MTAYKLENNQQTYTVPQEGRIVDFEEYCQRKETVKKSKTLHRRKGISVLGAILSVAAGLLLAVGFAAILPVEPEKMTFIMFVMWIFCGGALAWIFDEMGI